MTPEQVFSLANLTAAAAWVMQIVLGRKYWIHAVVIGAILPLLFAVLYTGLIITHWAEAEGGFGTLAGVQSLFSNQWMLLAGWMHYLAFDLFVGCWEVRDARQHDIPHWAIVPSLILTFLFGPVGLLLYFLIRSLKSRQLNMHLEIL